MTLPVGLLADPVTYHTVTSPVTAGIMTVTLVSMHHYVERGNSRPESEALQQLV